MRPRAFARKWYERRLPVWLRAFVAVAAVIGLYCGVSATVDGYHETLAYRDAVVCNRDGCVRKETGTILDRRSGQHCTTSSGSAGSTAGTAGGTGGTSTCTPYYQVRVSWQGGTDWLGTSRKAYQEAKPGDAAELRTWRGSVVRMEAYGEVSSYPPRAEASLDEWLALAWVSAIVLLWSLFAGRLLALFHLLFAGFFVVVLNGLFGTALLFWLPLVFCAVQVVLLAGAAVAARIAGVVTDG
ncbi:hypothetical protein [Streptomyces antimicrobicus]|uniref:Integral membrane protein n=1 Tax=Streptomyces antimicrobicus TaxID=2883108 RepID=A0ABS8BAZ1_9ACTN|nr:hypothetical protein [Streptomyces antimicrobicus]MCB5181728.1 hypothetical protein [Streptomyces antimicrobicus]